MNLASQNERGGRRRFQFSLQKMFAATTIVAVVVAIAAGAVLGQSTNPGLNALADAATDIVVAEVLETNPTKAPEGARDNARLKVVRTLKGPLEADAEIGLYHHLLRNTFSVANPPGLGDPKIELGKRYTFFLVVQRGLPPLSADLEIPFRTEHYELADQWLAVLPEHSSLETDVLTALHDVGGLWNGPARPSDLRVELLPEPTVQRVNGQLILSVKITNHSALPITAKLAHEWHGGEWPPTDLYAWVSHDQLRRPAVFEPVFLQGETDTLTSLTQLAPGESTTVRLRMDWPGTGSVYRNPMMTPEQSQYQVRILLVFNMGRLREFAAGATTRVAIAAE